MFVKLAQRKISKPVTTRDSAANVLSVKSNLNITKTRLKASPETISAFGSWWSYESHTA